MGIRLRLDLAGGLLGSAATHSPGLRRAVKSAARMFQEAVKGIKLQVGVRAPPRVGALRARSRLCSSNKLVVHERSLLVGRVLAAPWHTALPRWIAASAYVTLETESN